jgi:hypothetical protein
METTRKASARSKKEHKMSFKVASAAGTEDQQVRKIKNPFTDRAARVDYYQLLRKWRVDLYRYGLRLTYDLTIPDPGADLLSKLSEIESIRAQLEEEFTFNLDHNSITKNTYEDYIKEHGVSVDPTPDMEQVNILQDNSIWETLDEAESNRVRHKTGEISVPEEYQVIAALEPLEAQVKEPDVNTPEGERLMQRIDPSDVETLDHYFVGEAERYAKSGKYTVTVKVKGYERYLYIWKLFIKYRQEVFEKWQQKAWNAFLEAEKARYDERRKNLKDKLSRLLEEVGSQDPLSLRKIEREEVMKGVLRWLFGPSFYFAPWWLKLLELEGIDKSLYVDSGSVKSTLPWTDVLAKGDEIKFLHHAIEWENMLYFLYPYFWSVTGEWKEKMSIDHPDLMHRAFLKSGSVRVVLTIRPKFEIAFVKFMEGHRADLPSDDIPYLSIAGEMEAYANTNYPGVKAANPVENARPLLLPKQQKAWEDIQDISKLLKAYYDNKGNKYPSTAQGLAALSQFTQGKLHGVKGVLSVPIKDPWDHDYVYVSPGNNGEYDLLSYGADGQEDPKEDSQPRTDENADITSWAEASLIGTWYEYTPTSALDVAFAEEEMPDA